MNKKINLIELLKDCPKGMELDCTMFDDVTFIGVEKKIKPISIRSGEIYYYLTEFGTWSYDENAKCVIFPKGKTSWEGFQRPFIDGDVVSAKCDDLNYILIYYKHDDGGVIYCHSCYCFETNILSYTDNIFTEDFVDEFRFATEEEKRKLFTLIEKAGYQWNNKTKTLEKLIVPKFKAGDKIRHKSHIIKENIVTEIKDTHYILDDELALPFINQDNYELLPNKFDPKSLKPFDKVLVRQYYDIPWSADFYSYYDEVEGYVACTGEVHYDYCIPYNDDTKHLVGKLEDAPELYKYWEE